MRHSPPLPAFRYATQATSHSSSTRQCDSPTSTTQRTLEAAQSEAARQSSVLMVTAVTPAPRGLRKPFNSSGAPSTTFRSVRSPRDNVRDTRVQHFRDSILGTHASHPSVLSSNAIGARTLSALKYGLPRLWRRIRAFTTCAATCASV